MVNIASPVLVANDETEFWGLVGELSASDSVFEAQGDEHGQIDRRLQDRIESVLVPTLGPWEGSDAWFHNEDFFGNGVRDLLFAAPAFPWNELPALQACLTGEAAEFCIAIRLCDEIASGTGTTVGLLGILQGHIVISSSLSSHLK